MPENKYDKHDEHIIRKVARYYRPWAQAHTCAVATLILAVILLIFWCIYSNAMFVIMHNRLDTHRWCIDANEHRVLPPRADAELIEPPPFSYGEFLLDYSQREVRWRLADVVTPSVPTLTDINLRGPLSHEHAHTAEVQLAMGLHKDSSTQYFSGIEDIPSSLAADILAQPWAYYISFEDDEGREVARDSLSKTCFSNL